MDEVPRFIVVRADWCSDLPYAVLDRWDGTFGGYSEGSGAAAFIAKALCKSYPWPVETDFSDMVGKDGKIKSV